MGARDIDPRHREAFLALLAELEMFIPIDRCNIQRLLDLTKWPKGETAVMLAVAASFSGQCYPFDPVVSVGGPPNHVSKKAGVYEFNLRDSSRSQGLKGDQYFPITL